ncbi:hypothetical protein DCS_05965 [Drechmeria coniospora]|uniref:Uncharacterized protein n=1 Tax=Drechmeria coniospora TaxID=98403 RepID=A0A151GAB2_DRECN|nr:hypothetical protein DCS_05965 [Drechmeria coniospora]KYK54015.1 hypothetical protein DCS_05965 [Drechmeria coniospora]
MKFTNALLFATLASAGAIHRRHEEPSGSNNMLQVDESGTRLPLDEAGSEISVTGQGEITTVDESGSLLPLDKPGREISVGPAAEGENGGERAHQLPQDAPSIRSQITAIRNDIRRFSSVISGPNLRIYHIVTRMGHLEWRLSDYADALEKTAVGEPKEMIKLYRASFASDCLLLKSSIHDYVVLRKQTVEQYGECFKMERIIQGIQAQLDRVSKYMAAALAQEQQDGSLPQYLNDAIAEFSKGRCVNRKVTVSNPVNYRGTIGKANY